MLETLIATIMSFVGTNIDDIFINTLFFAQASSKRDIRSVVIGKYLGIGGLVLLSLLGAFGLQFIPQQYIGFLGLIPIMLGIKEWVGYLKSRNASDSEEEEKKADPSKGMVLNVVLVTIANGADNIGVYIPLFAGYTPIQMAVVVVIFALMIALWCLLGKKLSDLPVLRSFLLKYKYIMVPVVFVILGIYILIKSGLI